MPKKQWTQKDVEKLVTNPIYTGIGPYDAITSDDEYVKLVEAVIKDVGVERFVRSMLANLREAFPANATTVNGAYGSHVTPRG
jgi:hypothetical protein